MEKVKPKRRSQSERRDETRRKVLEAAISVLVDKGYAQLTTADVSDASGVSRGAQLNYYRTKNELIVAAAEYALNEIRKDALQFTQKARKSRTLLDDYIAHEEKLYSSPLSIALFEITTAMRTDQAIAEAYIPVLKQSAHDWDAVWKGLFIDSGYSPAQAEAIVEITTNLLRGVGIYALTSMPPSQKSKAVELWRGLLKSNFGQPDNSPPPVTTRKPESKAPGTTRFRSGKTYQENDAGG